MVLLQIFYFFGFCHLLVGLRYLLSLVQSQIWCTCSIIFKYLIYYWFCYCYIISYWFCHWYLISYWLCHWYITRTGSVTDTLFLIDYVSDISSHIATVMNTLSLIDSVTDPLYDFACVLDVTYYNCLWQILYLILILSRLSHFGSACNILSYVCCATKNLPCTVSAIDNVILSYITTGKLVYLFFEIFLDSSFHFLTFSSLLFFFRASIWMGEGCGPSLWHLLYRVSTVFVWSVIVLSVTVICKRGRTK